MCYSIQVAQSLKRLLRTLSVEMDYDEAERIFLQRLDNPTLNISRAFESNFDRPRNEVELRIKAAISEHRRRMAPDLQKELVEEEQRFQAAQARLSVKFTKSADKQAGIATRNIKRLREKMADLTRPDLLPKDERLYPKMYGGFIIRRDVVNLLTPMRYYCRPSGTPASIEKEYPTLYNARRDNLDRFWRRQFGHHHAIVVMDSFYEYVNLHDKEHRPLASGEKAKRVELQFTPESPEPMLMACIWSRWIGDEESVRGAAVITDDPTPEIAAAGHDRSPIALRPENVEAWLTPAGRTVDELQALLTDKQTTTYRHELAAAA